MLHTPQPRFLTNSSNCSWNGKASTIHTTYHTPAKTRVRAVSRFWFSAYRDLTVDQIERNHRIANGLRSKRLSDGDAAKWMRDL